VTVPDMLKVVNMIPNSWSDEQNQDCEPNLSVNPANPAEIIGTAVLAYVSKNFGPTAAKINVNQASAADLAASSSVCEISFESNRLC
jgi:hypothetical protein